MNPIAKLKKWHERKAWDYLRTTTDLDDINKAVHGWDEDASQALWNPLLSREQCEYLILNPSYSLALDIAKNPGFPPDLLHKLAMVRKDRFVLKNILWNPSNLPETKVMLSLMGVKDFDEVKVGIITY